MRMGSFKRLAEPCRRKEAEIVDAQGCYVFPGGIDPHTHLDMPFGGTVTADDFETGTIAAAFGGTTTVIDFCLTNKGKPLKQSVQTWHEKAQGKAVIDYGFHLMIAEINDDVLAELPSIIDEEGITSLKVFMAYKNVFQADDGTLYRTCLMAKEHGALVMVHAENGDVIDYLIKEALDEGNTDPIYHALTRPSVTGRRSDGAGGQADGIGRLAALCRSCHVRGGSSADCRSTESGGGYLGRNVPAIFAAGSNLSGKAEFRRCQICMVAAASRSLASRCAMECTEKRTASDGRLGSMLL